MKLYNKNGFLSRTLRFCAECAMVIDTFLVAGTLWGLIIWIDSGDTIPEFLQVTCWIILGGNAVVLLIYALYILWRESRRIRLGVLEPELICAIMEGEK